LHVAGSAAYAGDLYPLATLTTP